MVEKILFYCAEIATIAGAIAAIVSVVLAVKKK